MAVTLEQVEKLREKSGASYEACRDALDRADGDLLDAIIYLERTNQCRTGRSGVFTTKPGNKAAEAAKLVMGEAPQGGKKDKKKKDSDWREGAREIWEVGLNLLKHSTANQFEVWRKGKLMTSIPILILVLLIIVAFWISVPLLILGLFIGCRYQFVGPDLGKEAVNDVMDNVSAAVDDMVGHVKREFDESRKKVKKAQRAAGKVEREVDDLCGRLDQMTDELDDAVSGRKKK